MNNVSLRAQNQLNRTTDTSLPSLNTHKHTQTAILGGTRLSPITYVLGDTRLLPIACI